MKFIFKVCLVESCSITLLRFLAEISFDVFLVEISFDILGHCKVFTIQSSKFRI